MNHKVASVADLHADSVDLFNRVVTGTDVASAESIIRDLKEGINILRNSWEGADAGVQINDVVTVANAMIGIRNALGELAVGGSEVAYNYREIQRSNGATNLPELARLHSVLMTTLPPYSDTRDTVNINSDALQGKQLIDKAKNEMEVFIEKVKDFKRKMLDENWTSGAGVNEARDAFDTFVNNFNSKYKPALETVSTHISTALKNYEVM